MKRAFITGATGFLGRNILDQLAASGWEITALHRKGRKPEWAGDYRVEWREGDILEPASLEAAIPPEADALFHVAADTSVWRPNNERQRQTNVDGTHNVVEAALRSGVKRFIHTSTWNVYGLEQGEIREETPKKGRSSWINYNRTKAQAEEIVLGAVDRGLPAVVINPTHIIGRYDTANWARMITLVQQNRLPGVPPGGGSFCHAREVARTQIHAVEAGRTGANYLLGGMDASFLEVIRMIGEITGQSVPNRTVPASLLKLYARLLDGWSRVTRREPDLTPESAAMVCEYPRVVSDRAQRELSYQAVDLRTMLLDAYRWLSNDENAGESGG